MCRVPEAVNLAERHEVIERSHGPGREKQEVFPAAARGMTTCDHPPCPRPPP